jgi:hypothetical protein
MSPLESVKQNDGNAQICVSYIIYEYTIVTKL